MVYAGEPPLVWAIDRDTALVDGTITVTLRRFATEAPPTRGPRFVRRW